MGSDHGLTPVPVLTPFMDDGIVVRVPIASTLARYAEPATRFRTPCALSAFANGIGFASSSLRVDDVPVISRFYGVLISMYYNDHGLPHVHVRCGGQRASIEIRTGLVRGDLAPAVRRRVLEWLSLSRPELLDNWERARRRKPLLPVHPME